MTLAECYQQNQGQALLVPGGGVGNEGQCAQWADTVLHDVYGQPYVYTPGAIDWYLNAEALGLTQTFDRVSDGSIKKGDFVIYNTGVGSEYGHIDLAAEDGTFGAYVGYDSNWGKVYNSKGQPILHTVNHADRYNAYILGVLRLKAQAPKGDIMQRGTVELLYQVFGVPYGQNDLDYFTGTSVDDFAILLNNNPAHQTQAQTLADATKGFTQITEPVYRKDS